MKKIVWAIICLFFGFANIPFFLYEGSALHWTDHQIVAWIILSIVLMFVILIGGWMKIDHWDNLQSEKLSKRVQGIVGMILICLLLLPVFAKAETEYVWITSPEANKKNVEELSPTIVTDLVNNWEKAHREDRVLVCWVINAQHTPYTYANYPAVHAFYGVWITYKLKPQKTTEVIEHKKKKIEKKKSLLDYE